MYSSARKALKNNPILRELAENLFKSRGAAGAREAIQQASSAAPRKPIQDAMNQAGAIRMGARQLPDLPPRAPKPEFSVPEGSPVIRRLQQLRQEIGQMQGPRESTSADFGFQPAILGMRNPAGMQAPGTMFSRTGKVTEPGTKIGGRMMSGEYPNSPMRTVVRETEMKVSPGQGELPLDFRSNREVMSEVERMVAPGMGGRKIQDTSGVITEFDPGALVRSPGGRLTSNDIARMRGQQDPMRPKGVQVVDLKEEFTMDPRQARNTGLVGAGALAVGLDRILRDLDFSPKEMPVESKATAESQMPSAKEASQINELISSVVADASQQGGVYGELVLQNAPRDPSSYPSVLDYQAAQMQFLQDLTSGAYTLAEKIQQQRQAESFLQSEQTGENVTTETLTSELGSDDMANAVGAGQAEAEAMTTPPALAGPINTSTAAQGASDLATAATPRPKPETRMASTAMMQSLQDQIAARIAQDSEAAMRAGMSPMAQRIRFEGDIRDRDVEARASFDPRFDRR